MHLHFHLCQSRNRTNLQSSSMDLNWDLIHSHRHSTNYPDKIPSIFHNLSSEWTRLRIWHELCEWKSRWLIQFDHLQFCKLISYPPLNFLVDFQQMLWIDDHLSDCFWRFSSLLLNYDLTFQIWAFRCFHDPYSLRGRDHLMCKELLCCDHAYLQARGMLQAVFVSQTLEEALRIYLEESNWDSDCPQHRHRPGSFHFCDWKISSLIYRWNDSPRSKMLQSHQRKIAVTFCSSSIWVLLRPWSLQSLSLQLVAWLTIASWSEHISKSSSSCGRCSCRARPTSMNRDWILYAWPSKFDLAAQTHRVLIHSSPKMRFHLKIYWIL